MGTSPSGVAKTSGSENMALLVWGLSGIFSMMGAFSYAELGTMIRKNGGDYAYIFEAYGEKCVFLCMWLQLFVICPGAQAITALTFGEYAMEACYIHCKYGSSKYSVLMLAILVIGCLAMLNSLNMKVSIILQYIFTA